MGQDKFTCRWAALSLSSIAGVFLPDILLPREASERISHELVAVSTTGSKERAATWFTENKIPNASSITVHQCWEEMLENGDFDVVYISTPHPFHYQHVQKALQCKRNVLVEKPATMNRLQFEKLIDLAVHQGVVLMEAMWTRYLPATRYFQEELLPRIGEVKRVYAEFSFPIVSPDLSHSSRFLDKQAGAGSLLDQGIYALTWADIALNGLDKGASMTKVVLANSISVPGVLGNVDDINTVVLSKHTKDSGRQSAVAIITTSMTIPGSSKPSFYQRLQAKRSAPAVRIEGTKASVAVPFPPIRPEQLHVQWYGDEFVDADGIEKEEVIEKPVERGWGIWYQADVIAQRVMEQRLTKGPGFVIGAEESLRVLGYLDQARQLADIKYDDALEAI